MHPSVIVWDLETVPDLAGLRPPMTLSALSVQVRRIPIAGVAPFWHRETNVWRRITNPADRGEATKKQNRRDTPRRPLW